MLRRLWPNDDGLAEPIGEHLLVLSTVAAQFVKRVGFDAAEAVLCSRAL
jgi:hypothetical protein